jgi:hypothetical protein
LNKKISSLGSLNKKTYDHFNWLAVEKVLPENQYEYGISQFAAKILKEMLSVYYQAIHIFLRVQHENNSWLKREQPHGHTQPIRTSSPQVN